MALREFTDSAGRGWEAFAVIPRDQERRRYDRRSGETTLEDSPERRESDRRVTVGRTGHLDHDGWLCFQHAGERRRLTPIPNDWIDCDESRLAAYLESARPVVLRASLVLGKKP